MKPLISDEQWKDAKRVLYMTHLAIGDYYYQRGFLADLKRRYPHIELDIWIDDCRYRPKSWHTGRNQVLGQWLSTEPHIRRIYPIAASKKERKETIQKAVQENYDLVIFFADKRTENFASIARQIAPKGWVVGTLAKPKQKWLKKFFAFKKLNDYINIDNSPKVAHINDKYRLHFSCLFGVKFDANMPILGLDVPSEQQESMRLWVEDFKAKQAETNKLVLVNHLSTTPKRDLSWNHLVKLISGIHTQFPEYAFVLNLPPAELTPIKNKIAETQAFNGINITAFSAIEHFFQLPALILQSDVVITVETAVMHLASGLNAHQLVLMRESAKQWQPVNANKVLFGHSIINDITVTDMLASFNEIRENQ
ncbi:glycosyltransferase family 9 protein [Alteromonas sp. a30]|uniref:glycosyltransferase family 9 protein n=1 Tax=Alteromonas sp. a30 TaxID=2730917 RepID=UPI002281A74D|nr:glycosyltransferase family 9 protein [Alteromonas sp. a30]MCY7295760.1 glycosyltransferase family 9 protein [Alteromonas sp. a30]